MIGPIAIGGLGGSGTRVVAQILSRCGLYLGGSLNSEFDNIWFTVLFRRPQWCQQFPDDQDIQVALGIFERSMIEGLAQNLNTAEETLIENCAQVLAAHSKNKARIYKWKNQLVSSHGYDPDKYIGWGWKEPNSHIFLPQLREHFPKLTYIHVIRNGLDMAFSKNLKQARNWHRFFGFEWGPNPQISPSQALDYWVAANNRALDLANENPKYRCFLVRLEDLCCRPQEEIRRLLDFLHLRSDERLLNELMQIPKAPASVGRYLQSDLGQFSKTQFKEVSTLGYKA